MERFTTSFGRIIQIGLVSILVVFLGGCQKFLENTAETSLKSNEQEIDSYIAGSSLPFQKSASGLRYYISKTNPNGKTPQLGDEVVMHYILYTLKGTRLDSTSRKDNKPYAVVYGVQPLITGFQEGLGMLKNGEKAIFLMNHTLAFGSQSDAVLPAYSAIRIDVEILTVRNEEEQMDAYIEKKNWKNIEKTTSGLRFIADVANNPANPKVKTGDAVKVKYTGKLLNDKSFDAGEIPSLIVGSGGYIKGFEEGISKMGVGDKATVIFPSSLGYGTRGSGIILPYSPLVFEIEVLAK